VRVQRHGARRQTEHFVIYALSSPEFGRPRLGVAVSRRLGGAVVRNRLKRRVRECFRLNLRPIIPGETALVVIARRGAGGLETPTIKAELEAATLGLSKRLRAR
jgi:ribonuclease P protein component